MSPCNTAHPGDVSSCVVDLYIKQVMAVQWNKFLVCSWKERCHRLEYEEEEF